MVTIQILVMRSTYFPRQTSSDHLHPSHHHSPSAFAIATFAFIVAQLIVIAAATASIAAIIAVRIVVDEPAISVA